jgi:hypothetical protein
MSDKLEVFIYSDKYAPNGKIYVLVSPKTYATHSHIDIATAALVEAEAHRDAMMNYKSSAMKLKFSTCPYCGKPVDEDMPSCCGEVHKDPA